ncbi:phage holin family protein [Entomomonas sp. E2T0]|uniref:phage holin family protein n=1 Tax=Entomomonas sp. E2T0 TaxID=2930213 RepID=UPI002228132E|nr:phage holin family protein [Entomomonas sp. E2T0]UYZ83364.1 phage holin family protein [Entomomonas sp. E2T0]
MPNKDPNLWQSIYLAITASATWQGAIMASIIAILRILYDGKETKPLKIILEAVIFGALSLCVVSI